MYARVSVTTSTRKEALVVPATAVVDLGGRRGVFTPLNETAVFRALDIGTEQNDLVEVLGGLADGDTVITTGSSALRDGDRIVLPGGAGGRGRRGGANGATANGSLGRRGQSPSTTDAAAPAPAVRDRAAKARRVRGALAAARTPAPPAAASRRARARAAPGRAHDPKARPAATDGAARRRQPASPAS